ncbi:MAG: FAD-dependent oxidoreductase [Planctomycetota bacterium]
MQDVLVIGAGAFGLTAAIELRRRGCRVTVVDPGPVPGARQASADLNKAVRMEYGADRQYLEMVDRSIDGWEAWNARFGVNVYEPTGVLMLAGPAMADGGFEFESLRAVGAVGHTPERLSGVALVERFAAWRPGQYAEGFYHARGGYTRSALTVEKLAGYARELGVAVRIGDPAARLVDRAGRVAGAALASGEEVGADHTVVAAGVWTTRLVPELGPMMRATAHPIFYLRPRDPAAYRPPRFCVFCADVANTGWYGFPVDDGTGLLKLAKHDAGDPVDPDAERGGVSATRVDELRAFLRSSLPGLVDAELVDAKRCFYSDTLDGHFVIDRHPERAGLTVATGGSGHAMKMAPVLGGLIADAVEGASNDWLGRFAWRTQASSVPGDAARATS